MTCVLLAGTWILALQGMPQPGPNVAGTPEYRATVQRVLNLMYGDSVEWAGGSPSQEGPAPKAPLPPPTSPKGQSAVPVLVETVQAEDAATRLRGLEGLAETAGPEHIDDFVAALSDPLPEAREMAARILARLDRAAVLAKIMAVLCGDDADKITRLYAVLPSLKEVLEPGMIQVLESEQESSLRKQVAAYSLGRMGSIAALPALTAGAWSSQPEVALACTNGVLAIHDPMILPRLVDLVRHPAPEVRNAAVQGIADVGGREAIAVLARVALEPSEDNDVLGRQAVALLGATKDEAAIPSLIQVMRAKLSLRRAAVEALHKITGERLGDRPSDWAEWYQNRQKQGGPPPGAAPVP